MKTENSYSAFVALAAAVTGGFGQAAVPHIAEQPTDQMVYVGDSAAFSVHVDGASPLAYQWRLNDTALVGKTAPDLNLTHVTFEQAGAYSVVVSNGDGNVTSQTAWLSVLPTNVVNLGTRELFFGQLSPPLWGAARVDDESPCITSDGLTLFYGSRAPDGLGDWDLWMLTRASVSSAWDAPVNLGPTVNSPSVETAPRLAPDGLSLYFVCGNLSDAVPGVASACSDRHHTAAAIDRAAMDLARWVGRVSVRPLGSRRGDLRDRGLHGWPHVDAVADCSDQRSRRVERSNADGGRRTLLPRREPLSWWRALPGIS